MLNEVHWSLPEDITLSQAIEHNGRTIGQVVELPFSTKPGDHVISTEFSLNIDPENYDVITSGPHMWSQSTSVQRSRLIEKTPFFPTNHIVGRRPFTESLENSGSRYYEPGFSNRSLSADEGRSFSFVTFRHKRGGENYMVGIIPGLDAFERITYKEENGKVVVSVQKDFEGISTSRDSSFRIFLGFIDSQGHFQLKSGHYANLLAAYGKELAKYKGDVPLLENTVIGFSWPRYGKHITQEIIEQEIEAGSGLLDMYVIDAGWATQENPFQVDEKKFPDMAGLVAKMREAGVIPGLWVAPFMVKPKFWKESELVKDSKGHVAKDPLNKRAVLDVSIPQVREYIVQQLVRYAQMGFRAFKLDFLSNIFVDRLRETDKTSVKYYRQTIQEIREATQQAAGEEIVLIGCGGPWLESLGLFNGVRMTIDSSMPLFPPILRRSRDKRVNRYLYADATAVAARRAIPFGKSFGLIFDGIHIDPDVALGGRNKARLNRSILALRKLGISNMFVGDSLRNLSDETRTQWQEFIEQFKNTV